MNEGWEDIRHLFFIRKDLSQWKERTEPGEVIAKNCISPSCQPTCVRVIELARQLKATDHEYQRERMSSELHSEGERGLDRDFLMKQTEWLDLPKSPYSPPLIGVSLFNPPEGGGRAERRSMELWGEGGEWGSLMPHP